MYPANYSAKDTAITQRPPSSALLCIDAADRYSNYTDRADDISAPFNSAYDFTITRSASIMNGFFTRIGVSEVVFPWTIPNINARTNSIVFGYTIAPAPTVRVDIDLDDGFYTPAQLAARIQVLVRAVNPALNAFTITYGIQTVDVAASVNRPIFEYKSNNPAVQVYFEAQPDNSFYNENRIQLFDLMGFSSLNELPELEAIGYDTYCQYTRYIDIVCSQLTNSQALKDTMTQKTARDVICRIYIGDAAGVQSTVSPSSATFCPPGCAPTTIYKNFSVPKYIQWIPNQPVPGYLRFEVYDQDGFSLKELESLFARQNDWSMTLLVSEN